MTTNTIFKSKEHYQAFRKAWSNAVNSDAAKSHTKPCDEYIEGQGFSKGTGTHRVPGNVTAAHMVLYNLLRGRSYDHGFTPVTRKTKLQNGFYINHGLYQAVQELKWRMKNESFLEIFEGTVDADMISKLQLPDCKPMHSDYGPYKKVAEMIMGRQGEAGVNITFEHVDNLYKMVTEEVAA